MIKNILILSVVLVSSIYAVSPLSKIPYGMEFGKKIPIKVENRSHYDKDNNHYNLDDKFSYYIDENKLLTKIVFNNGYSNDSKKAHKLPKKWYKLGLLLCTPNLAGTTYEAFKNILKNQDDIKYINHKVFNNWDIVEFEVAGKYFYNFLFAIDKTKEILNCKTGLYKIEITDDVLDEEY